jgi:hypothetical protein
MPICDEEVLWHFQSNLGAFETFRETISLSRESIQEVEFSHRRLILPIQNPFGV